MREIDIERLVQWAYRDELPKRGIGTIANGWDNMERWIEHLTVIDEQVEPGFPAVMGAPHPDALTIERAVEGLKREVRLDWGEYQGLLLGDVIGIAPDQDPLAQRVFSESALVATFGRLGATPLWRGERPLPTPVTKKGVVMLVGRCQGKERYDAGSHCLIRYMPSVDQVALRRAEYLVWRDGLANVAGILRGWTLKDHIPLAPAAPALPWLDGHRTTPLPVAGVAPAWTTWSDPPPARRASRMIKTPAISDR